MTDTATQLLDAAQRLVQERGFNAFSYKDLATQIGIRTASIHYHFQGKADLAAALMARYQERLEASLAEIEARGRTSIDRLKRFIGLYRTSESEGVVCLCGSMATDHETLPKAVQEAVATYLARSETWVKRQLEAGVRDEEFSILGRSGDLAATLVASLQGGLILARANGSKVVDRVQRSFLASLEVS